MEAVKGAAFFFSVFAAGDFTKLGDFFLDITDIRAVSDLTLELMARGWNCGPPPYRGDGRMTTAHIPCFEHGELVHLGFK